MRIFKSRKKKPDDEECIRTQCPQYTDGIENYKVETFKTSEVRIGKVHAIGKRENQQDSFAYSDVDNEEIVQEKGMLMLVADGMGGMSNGAEVSAKVAVECLRYFDNNSLSDGVPQYLEAMAQYVNDKVNELLGRDGIGRGGSTLVAMHIKDKKAYWISIGDSLIYIYHAGSLVRLNKLHNYETQLNEMVANGEMTMQEAMLEPNKAALTSYIGAGEIALIDQNTEPIQLKQGDRIVLMSDGVGTVSEDELCSVLRYDAEEAALKLRYLIEQKNKRNQDNFTALIIEGR